ncbi:MAG: hypothetical protein LBU05_02945, partial [Bifidobacteriaceae bacterium]|nr:hypothetical protein [Bifidobacteriaceae bacterium]
MHQSRHESTLSPPPNTARISVWAPTATFAAICAPITPQINAKPTAQHREDLGLGTDCDLRGDLRADLGTNRRQTHNSVRRRPDPG